MPHRIEQDEDDVAETADIDESFDVDELMNNVSQNGRFRVGHIYNDLMLFCFMLLVYCNRIHVLCVMYRVLAYYVSCVLNLFTV